MQTLCVLPLFLFISYSFRIQDFIFLFLNKSSVESKIDFRKFPSCDLNFKDRDLEEKGLHYEQIIIPNCSKYLCIFQLHHNFNNDRKNKNISQLLLYQYVYYDVYQLFRFFFRYRLMMKKCMAANISGLFQGGMKTSGGNPGLIPHNVSARIFSQPWKVILEWILSLSAQKRIRLYLEGLVFFLQLFYYTISQLTHQCLHSKALRREVCCHS